MIIINKERKGKKEIINERNNVIERMIQLYRRIPSSMIFNPTKIFQIHTFQSKGKELNY